MAGDVDKPDSVIQDASRTDPLRLLRLLVSMGNFVQGNSFDALRRVVSSTMLLTWMRKVLQNPKDHRIPEVARAISQFQLGELREALLPHLNSKRIECRISAAHALARLAHPDDMEPLGAALESLADSRRDLVLLIMVAFATERPDRFVQYLESGGTDPDRMHLLALEVAGSLNLMEAGPIILKILKSARAPETIAAALTAAGNLRLASAHEAMHTHLLHQDEQVRGVAAWALGRLQIPGDAPTLASLLEDRSWSVRLNAAAALLELGPAGAAALRSVLASTTDRYARDMAQNALSHLELGVPLA
jgi:HEAT repeat protein